MIELNGCQPALSSQIGTAYRHKLDFNKLCVSTCVVVKVNHVLQYNLYIIAIEV